LFNSKLNGRKLGFNTPLSSANAATVKLRCHLISLFVLICEKLLFALKLLALNNCYIFQIYRVIYQWENKFPGQVTVGELVEVLKKANLLNVAVKLRP